MTTFPHSPKLLRAGIVLIDPDTSVIERIVPLQYNPDSLSRSLAVQAFGADSTDRSQALRLKGPAVETIKLEAELDATDRLESPDQNPDVTELGLHAQLAALETLVHPTTAQLDANNQLAQAGTLEIAPMEAPLALFVWSRQRVLPVRITELSITEEAFDPDLNPIRAKVSLGMRVLSVDDLGFSHKGGSLFMSYLRAKEQLAARSQGGSLSDLGHTGVP